MSEYNFNQALTTVEMLEILVADPVFRVVCNELPWYEGGRAGRPPVGDRATVMAMGAATVVCGSDRRGEAEVHAQWDRLRASLAREGWAPSERPPTSQNFRDYRERFLTQEVLEHLRSALRVMDIRRAQPLGYLNDPSESWMSFEPTATLIADGTWFAPASEVGLVPEVESRALHQPRTSEGADVRGKARGYAHVAVVVRGRAERSALILDVVRAPGGVEMDVVVDACERIHDLVGLGFRYLVYDGAMEGTHLERLAAMGVLGVNKPKGIRAKGQWEIHLGSKVAANRPLVALDLGECRHLVTFASGLAWGVRENASGELVRERTLEHQDVRMVSGPQGSHFEVDLMLWCQQGPHYLTWRTNQTLPSLNGGHVNLSSQLRAIPPNEKVFWQIYGQRNAIESLFRVWKDKLGMGRRARSFTARAHEVDLLLTRLIYNALTWAEHRPSAKALARMEGRAA